MGDRLTVGLQPLELRIGVQIPVPQPNFNMTENTHNCDWLIIGGGIAGLSAALEASKYGQVILLTKGKIGETATEKAQGGIAAAIDQVSDSTQFHFEDTIAAGAGLCNEAAVKVLVTEGVDRVKELIGLGAQFDKAETEAGGTAFALNLEGAHKRRRIPIFIGCVPIPPCLPLMYSFETLKKSKILKPIIIGLNIFF